MAKIAFVTFAKKTNITPDDQLAADILINSGHQVSAAVWDDAAIDWSAFDSVVIRSCWDYHLKPEAFRSWLSALHAAGVSVWNPVETIRWNMDKGYLRLLQEQGVAIPDTYWPAPGEAVDLAALLKEKNWEKAVIKPLISASAYQTFTIAQNDELPALQQRWSALSAEGEYMIQRFAREVTDNGEWSLLFFGGKFSHGVLKRPKAGEFRSQSEYGGTIASRQPATALVERAAEILALLPAVPLYARVDGIDSPSGFTLMELELIEPFLFLDEDPRAAQNFADAISRRL